MSSFHGASAPLRDVVVACIVRLEVHVVRRSRIFAQVACAHGAGIMSALLMEVARDPLDGYEVISMCVQPGNVLVARRTRVIAQLHSLAHEWTSWNDYSATVGGLCWAPSFCA